MKIIVELTNDEASMIRYALNEMADKRQEQALDSGIKHIYNEAEKHRELAKKFKIGPEVTCRSCRSTPL